MVNLRGHQSRSLVALQAREAGFDALLVAGRTPGLEPAAKHGPYIVVLALAGTKIQPKARIGIPIAGTASVGVDLLKECVRGPHQLVGIEGRK